MTKLTLLNRDNKKMTGGGNVKQGLRPLATGFFGFRLWTEKKSSYSGVRFVGDTITPSPPGPWTATLEIVSAEGKIGYSNGHGDLSQDTYKGVKITEIYLFWDDKFYLVFETQPPPSFTKITVTKDLDTESLSRATASHEENYYEWDAPASADMKTFFDKYTGDTVTLTIE